MAPKSIRFRDVLPLQKNSGTNRVSPSSPSMVANVEEGRGLPRIPDPPGTGILKAPSGVNNKKDVAAKVKVDVVEEPKVSAAVVQNVEAQVLPRKFSVGGDEDVSTTSVSVKTHISIFTHFLGMYLE